jgi:hypothetical protein
MSKSIEKRILDNKYKKRAVDKSSKLKEIRNEIWPRLQKRTKLLSFKPR